MAATAAKNTKVPRRPTTLNSTPPMMGPVAKPARSTRASRPRFSPARAGSKPAVMARAAGMKEPAAAPTMARAARRAPRESARAKATPPTAAKASPPSSSRFAHPRSASGARIRPATRPTRNPVAAIRPRLDVDSPVASWRSEISANTTLVEALSTNVEMKISRRPAVAPRARARRIGARHSGAGQLHPLDATGGAVARPRPNRRGVRGRRAARREGRR